MQIITLNVNRASEERMNRSVQYLLHNQFDLMVLTEFVPTTDGATLICQKLTNAGYYVQSAHGLLIASTNNLLSRRVEQRWVEVTMSHHDLAILGVYIPDKGGEEKNVFWQRVLDYTTQNADSNALLLGDFNSYTKEDSATGTEQRAYNPKELRVLKALGWIDVWEQYHGLNDLDRFTWYHHYQVGVRLDYIFMSPRLGSIISKASAYHDAAVRKQTKDALGWLSDHSPVIANLEWSV